MNLILLVRHLWHYRHRTTAALFILKGIYFTELLDYQDTVTGLGRFTF